MAEFTAELRIIGDSCSPVSSVLGILEQTGFSRGRWENLHALTFMGSFYDSPEMQISSEEPICEYITKVASGITEIDFGDSTGNDLFVGLRELAQQSYAPKLHSLSLHSWSPIQSITDFSKSLSKIDVDSLILNYAPRQPLFPSSQLTHLKIRNFNRDPVWDYFDADAQGAIHFTKLRKLDIQYEDGTPKKQLVSVDGLNIQFPSLMVLRVENSAKVYSDFYQLFKNSPIRILQCIDGPVQLSSIDPQVIRSADRISMVATKNGAGIASDAFQRVVSVRSPISVARLSINASLANFTRVMEWPNLRYLFLTLDRIRLVEFQALLARLPRLWHLGLWCESRQPFAYRSTFLNASITARSKMFSSSIQELTLGVTYRWVMKDYMLLERFAQRLPSLLKLRVSKENLPMFANFIGHPGTRVVVECLEHYDECIEC